MQYNSKNIYRLNYINYSFNCKSFNKIYIHVAEMQKFRKLNLKISVFNMKTLTETVEQTISTVKPSLVTFCTQNGWRFHGHKHAV